jgi:hypothetical protein
VAPQAAQIAALEEHAGTDARTVVDGEALNIKNVALHEIRSLLLMGRRQPDAMG